MTETRDTLDGLLAEAVPLALGRPCLPRPGADEPEDEAILRYLDAELPPREQEALRQRLACSSFASERLAVLRESLAEAERGETPSPPAVGQPLRLSFLLAADGLRYLCGSLAPKSLVPVPVATRGKSLGTTEESSFFDFEHRFGDLEVQILLERVPGNRLDLQLQLLGERSPRTPLRVSLSDRDGAVLDSQPVERGMARFCGMPPACHRISITDPQRELGQILLDVHPA